MSSRIWQSTPARGCVYRYDPAWLPKQNPLQLDSKAPSIKVADYAYNETRYRMLLKQDEARAEELMRGAEADAIRRWSMYSQLAEMDYSQMASASEDEAENPAKDA